MVVLSVDFLQVGEDLYQVDEESPSQVLDIVAPKIQADDAFFACDSVQLVGLLDVVVPDTYFGQSRELFDPL